MNVFFYTCLYKILLLYVFTAFCMNGIRYNVNNRKIMITIIRFFKKKKYLKRKKKYHHQFIKFFKEFIFLINLIVLLGFKIVFDAVNFSALKREFSSMQRNSRHWGELQSTNYLGSKMDYQSSIGVSQSTTGHFTAMIRGRRRRSRFTADTRDSIFVV